MNRVIVTRPYMGLCGMQVCAVSDATDEEILKVSRNENPCGTTNGWCAVVREDEEGRGPVTCEEDPKRTHFIVEC